MKHLPAAVLEEIDGVPRADTPLCGAEAGEMARDGVDCDCVPCWRAYDAETDRLGKAAALDDDFIRGLKLARLAGFTP